MNRKRSLYCGTCARPMWTPKRHRTVFCGALCEEMWRGICAQRDAVIVECYFGFGLPPGRIAETYGKSRPTVAAALLRSLHPTQETSKGASHEWRR